MPLVCVRAAHVHLHSSQFNACDTTHTTKISGTNFKARLQIKHISTVRTHTLFVKNL